SSRKTGQIAVIGIDIGKNSFHIVGLDKRGAIILRQKWSRSQVEALGHDARLMPAKYVRAYSKGQKNGNCRGRAAADDEICGDQDFRTARLAGAAPGARAIGQSTHWHHQSNPRLFAGARDRRAPGAALPARRAAPHSWRSLRAPFASHGPDHRGLGWRLATTGRAHRWSIRRHRGVGTPGRRLGTIDERPGHGQSSLARWSPRSALERFSLRAAISPPGWALSPSKSQPAIARSWAKYPNAAIATCACCSCKQPGSCWSSRKSGSATG